MNDKNRDDIRRRLEELRKENDRKKRGGRGGSNGGKGPFFTSSFVFLLVILAAFLLMYMQDIPTVFQERKEIPYTEFVTSIKNGKFTEIEEKDDKLFSVVKEDNKNIIYSTRKVTERVGNDPNIINAVNSKKVKLIVASPSQGALFITFLLHFLPMILAIGLMVYLARRMMANGQGGPGNVFGFGKSRADKLDKKPDVKFDDVAGVDGAKEELKEVVDFLKNPEKYTKAGARVPKGVLLLGRPGTGKTLLAKAVAGESGASFFSISGSEFVEMFVGVGASRVRDLFEKAKNSSPSIIFIDEIDAIGRKRSVGKNSGSNEEREQTLNQLLVEMDGFETDAKVIVIAATNREDVLDPALLRAGRFDRRISVDAPDMQGRVAILKVHAKNKKLADDVKLEDIAKITPGFVGADLANLLNEAAILAARKASDTITMEDMDEAVDKIGMGLGQKGKIIKPEEKRLLAYHEAGHAIMTELTPGADPVHKVTIIPRGEAGGFMMPLPEERLVNTRRQILAEIKVLFGGRAAEELVLDDISTGAYSDIKRATNLARVYISSVGMSKKLGPVNLEDSAEEFIFTSNKSNETAREIDLEIREMLNKEYQLTMDMLRENRSRLDGVAELLLKKETITGDEVRKIISGISVAEILNENIPENKLDDVSSDVSSKDEDPDNTKEEVIDKAENSPAIGENPANIQQSEAVNIIKGDQGIQDRTEVKEKEDIYSSGSSNENYEADYKTFEDMNVSFEEEVSLEGVGHEIKFSEELPEIEEVKESTVPETGKERYIESFQETGNSDIVPESQEDSGVIHISDNIKFDPVLPDYEEIKVVSQERHSMNDENAEGSRITEEISEKIQENREIKEREEAEKVLNASKEEIIKQNELIESKSEIINGTESENKEEIKRELEEEKEEKKIELPSFMR